MQQTAQTLADLLHRVGRRDRAAFDALYKATSAKLYGIVLRILKRRDLADEVLQEVYVQLWARAGDFQDGRASPITWMAVIARNRALDHLRRRAPLAIEDTPEALAVPTDEPHPLLAIELDENLARLRACLDRLEPQRREMVVLAYLDGASRDDMSRRYGHPTGTIKTWLHRALAQLKECLAP